MTDFNYYLKEAYNEELLEGQVFGVNNSKSMIRHIESLDEYNEVLSRCREPRGVIVGDNFYFQNTNADIIHANIIDYLERHNLLKINKMMQENDYYSDESIKYEEYLNDFLCVHAIDGKIWIGESYNTSRVADYPEVDKYFELLDKLDIPYNREVL